jgi:hypothetical protein
MLLFRLIVPALRLIPPPSTLVGADASVLSLVLLAMVL